MANVHSRCAIGIALALCLMLVASPARGQQVGGLQTSGTSYRIFVRPGQNTVQVLLLGDVGQPGLYKVGEDTDLIQLLALSGGERSEGGGGGRRLRREGDTTVRLYRPSNGERELIFEAEMDEFVARSAYPALKTGDVIQVETKRGFPWFDTVRFLTTTTTFVLTVIRFVD